jgi:hypothetical protein
MNEKLSIGDAAALLLGAGLTKLDNLAIGLTLIGVGVALKVGVAYLQRQGLEVSGKPDEENMG